MRKVMRFALASASILAIASPAYAQDPTPTGEAASEDEILVSARRRDEGIEDVPLTVNVVTDDAIDNLNLRKLEDITSIVPGLSLTPNPNGIGSVNTLRGTNFDVNISGNSASVEFYYNDAPISSNVVQQSLFDIGQIEVLRGPQGTLRGRSSPSGSINLTTRRPDLEEFGAVMSNTVTHTGGYNINGGINVPLVKDKLAVRIAGLVSNDDGSRVEPIGGGKLENKTQAGRISLRADPFDGVLILDGSYQNLVHNSLQYTQYESFKRNEYCLAIAACAATADSPAFTGGLISAEDRLAVIGRLANNNDQRFGIWNWGAQLKLWDQRLVYVGQDSKQHLQADAPSDGGGFFGTNQVGAFNLFSGNPAAPIVTGQTSEFEQATNTNAHNATHEIRLQDDEPLFGMMNYVVGFLWRPEASSLTDFNRIIGARGTPAPPARPTSITDIQYLPLTRYGNDTEKSVFGHLTFNLPTGTEVGGGVRHIWSTTDSGLLIGGVDQANLRRNAEFTATIYTASVKQDITDDIMVYASTGTSWRPPTVVIGGPTQSATVFMSAIQAQFQSTPPEKSTSYEVGVRSSWFDDRLTLNLTGYIQDFDSYPYRNLTGVFSIVPVAAPPNACSPAVTAGCRVEAPQYATAATVKVKGVEAEVVVRPLDNLYFFSTISYADGKIKNASTPCTDLNGDGIDDQLFTPPSAATLYAAVGQNFVDVCNVTQRANAASPWNASFSGEYFRPLFGDNEAYLRGLFSWHGNSLGEPTNPIDQIESYGLLNFYLGLRDPDGAWDISFFAKNVTDTFRVLNSLGPQLTSTLSHGTLGAGSLNPPFNTNYYGIGASTEPREFGVNFRFALGSR